MKILNKILDRFFAWYNKKLNFDGEAFAEAVTKDLIKHQDELK